MRSLKLIDYHLYSFYKPLAMIRNVFFSSRNIEAGDTLTVEIEAAYPVVIEIYCFVTQPPPTKFVPCPSSGSHSLTYRRPFDFETSRNTFVKDGRLEVSITDAERDFKKYEIHVSGLDRPLTVEA